MKYSFELETPKKATREETILLYGLGEELLITKKFVEDFTRLSTDKIRVDITCNGDEKDALLRIVNALRCSKNYMAHICGVTIV